MLELILIVIIISSAAYFAGAKKVAQFANDKSRHYTNTYYSAWYTALWTGIPAILVTFILLGFDDYFLTTVLDDQIIYIPIAIITALIGFALAWHNLQPHYNTRKSIEKLIYLILLVCSTVAILTTLGIILSVLFETIQFFKLYPLQEFLFGLHWNPQTAIREDQVGSSGAFGFVPLFTGTIMISFIAMMIAAPIGFLSTIFLGEYALPKVRAFAKPILEILAGIPTVVYGFFAALWVAPWVRDTAAAIGLEASSESALAAGLVMGIMLIPFICSLSDDAIVAVPNSLRDSSYAMGATRSETIMKIILPAALPGIIGSFLLAISRAIGETMIVVMAAGLTAKLSGNPLDAMTTVTVQITTLLVGDHEFDSAKTLASFALGLTLFVSTLLLNITALITVRRYREKYE